MSRNGYWVSGLLLLVIVALGGVAYWQYQRAEAAAEQLGLDAGRVVSAVFTQARELRVSRLTGQVRARSTDDGWVFNSEQNTRAPFATSYFVDLKQVNDDDLDWDAERKLMTIRIPDVIVEKPSVDMSRAQVQIDGLWVSRRASIDLNRKGAGFMATAADAAARSDENMRKAREAAAKAVSAYVRQPLRAAGFRDIEVEVLFAWEGTRSPERWDRSRRPEEVIADPG